MENETVNVLIAFGFIVGAWILLVFAITLGVWFGTSIWDSSNSNDE